MTEDQRPDAESEGTAEPATGLQAPPGTDAETDTEGLGEAEPDTDTEPPAEAEPDTDTEVPPEAEPQTDHDAESETAPTADTDVGTDSQADPDTEPEPAAAAAVAGPGAVTPRRGTRDPLAAVLIGVLTLLLGFAFAVQVRSVGDDQQYVGAREEDLVRILDELNAREDRLREQIADQRTALQQLSSSDSQSEAALEEARRRAEAIAILNGTIAARGPGLMMTIRDPEDAVRVADILDAIQELRGAGAETMQIDGVRVGVSTAVTGEPGNLMLDGRPITAPYEFRVIGSPQNMETALNIPGGAVSRFTNRGGTVIITQSEDVTVDALRPLDTPQYASPDTGD